MKMFGFPQVLLSPEVGSGSAATPGPTPTPSAPSAPSSSGSASGASSGDSSPAPSAPAASPPAAASPSSSTPEGGTPAVGGEDPFDFSSIFETSGDQPSPREAVESAATPKKPVEAAKPPVVAETPKPAEAAAKAPESPAAPSPKDPAAPAAEAPRIDPSDPVSIARALGENEAAAIEHVANTLFKLSLEDVEALEADTIGTIPKLLAKSFVKAQQTMMEQMGRMIPQMIQRHGEITKRNSENEGKFFARWPDLKPDAHRDLVNKYGAAYRAMHPQATLEQMIEDLGPMVMMAAKVVPTIKAEVPSAPGGNGVRPPPSSPFVPAVGGPGGTSTTEQLEPFEAMFAHKDE